MLSWRACARVYRTYSKEKLIIVKNIAILGSTGSIGKNTLEIVRKNPSALRIKVLTANSNWEMLARQAREFEPEYIAIADRKYGILLKKELSDTKIKIGMGADSVVEAAAYAKVDAVVAAIVGAAGLRPVMAAIEKGREICLANKETLVVGGSLVTEAVKRYGAQLLPVDSEHSAIFQCLQNAGNNRAKRIIITASGGPFRTFEVDAMSKVTPEAALKHPNWNMGGKITIDSATLMNKGLEVMEAHWLFNIDYEKIDVVVHPQSIVHSLVEFSDGSVIAQLGWPDMKLPIQYALSHPQRWGPTMNSLDLIKVGAMTFEAPRLDDFPCLKYAYEAGKIGKTAPCVLNAANEVAVDAFLQKKIGFTAISKLIHKTFSSFEFMEVLSVDQLLEVDASARKRALDFLESGEETWI